MMLFAGIVAHAAQNSVLNELEGATIVASDGQFLGKRPANDMRLAPGARKRLPVIRRLGVTEKSG